MLQFYWLSLQIFVAVTHYINRMMRLNNSAIENPMDRNAIHTFYGNNRILYLIRDSFLPQVLFNFFSF